jgi:hypothetical protein
VIQGLEFKMDGAIGIHTLVDLSGQCQVDRTAQRRRLISIMCRTWPILKQEMQKNKSISVAFGKNTFLRYQLLCDQKLLFA